jgi:hypothetical protein
LHTLSRVEAINSSFLQPAYTTECRYPGVFAHHMVSKSKDNQDNTKLGPKSI